MRHAELQRFDAPDWIVDARSQTLSSTHSFWGFEDTNRSTDLLSANKLSTVTVQYEFLQNFTERGLVGTANDVMWGRLVDVMRQREAIQHLFPRCETVP
jgi:hypothetical protein